MSLYGHYCMRAWSDLIRVTEDGVQFEGASYRWSDLDRVEVVDYPLVRLLLFVLTLGIMLSARARVYAADGTVIQIRASMLAMKADDSDAPMAKGREVFDELIAKIEAGIASARQQHL